MSTHAKNHKSFSAFSLQFPKFSHSFFLTGNRCFYFSSKVPILCCSFLLIEHIIEYRSIVLVQSSVCIQLKLKSQFAKASALIYNFFDRHIVQKVCHYKKQLKVQFNQNMSFSSIFF